MKKSKLLTLGLLAGAGLLLSINQAQAADTLVKNVLTGIFYKMAVSLKQMGAKCWLKDGNTWYSLADNGAMRTGWYKEMEGKEWV